MKRGSINLVEGSVGQHLVSLGVFLALNVVAVMTISLIDIYYVSRLGHTQLAALSFVLPILMIVNAVSLGLGNGVIAVVARAVGAGNRDVIRTLSTDAMLLGIAIMLVMAGIGYLSIEPMFTLMGASPEVLPFIKQYMTVWYLSVGVQIIPGLLQNVLRALGDMRTSAVLNVVICTMILGLDPLLIFGWGPVPAFGIQGAAIANAIVRIFTMICMVSVLHFRMRALAPISLSMERLRRSWGQLLYVGLPSTSAQLAMPVSSALLTKIIALSGIGAVAAYGVASRIEMFASVFLWGIAGSMTAFVGQNAGARRMDRVQEAVGLAIKACIAVGLCLTVVALTAGNQMVAHFSDDTEVRTLAVEYLRLVSLGYGLSGLVMIASQTMNALHRPLPAATLNLARTVGVTIPFVVLGHYLGGIHGVFIAILLAGTTCGAMAWVAMTRIVSHESQRLTA
jgi:putative MATE family efflux protein